MSTRFVDPERHAALQRLGGEVLARVLLEWPTPDWRERDRQKWIERLSKFDGGMIAAAGLTVQDLVDLRFSRLRDQRNGEKYSAKPEYVAQRQLAYAAIRDADRVGMPWTEALRHVQEASVAKVGRRHSAEIDRKTIDRWMRALHGWGLIKLVPPEARGRGRPRKKE